MRYGPFLYAPWRSTYIRRAARGSSHSPAKPALCVFCASVAKGARAETLILHIGKTCAVILNKFPYNNGHLMVIPPAPYGSL